MATRREKAEELRAKYAQMLSMRLSHASGDEDRSKVRDQMLALASRFPGALREMDDLALDEIHRRIGCLDAVLQELAEDEPWMNAVWTFHELARGVLVIKRWLGGQRTVDASLEAAFACEIELSFPEEVRGWAADLSRVAAPPRGRVMDLVFTRLAQRIGTTEAEARHLVFGSRRR